MHPNDEYSCADCGAVVAALGACWSRKEPHDSACSALICIDCVKRLTVCRVMGAAD